MRTTYVMGSLLAAMVTSTGMAAPMDKTDIAKRNVDAHWGSVSPSPIQQGPAQPAAPACRMRMIKNYLTGSKATHRLMELDKPVDQLGLSPWLPVLCPAVPPQLHVQLQLRCEAMASMAVTVLQCVQMRPCLIHLR